MSDKHGKTNIVVEKSVALAGSHGPYLELPSASGLPLQHARADDYATWSVNHARSLGLVGEARCRALMRLRGFVGLDAFTYSYASFDRLITAGLFCQWLYFLDDSYDDNADNRDLNHLRVLFERQAVLFEKGEDARPATALERLTVAVRQRLLSCVDNAWWTRFLIDVHGYMFDGSYQAMRWWQSGEMPDEETYRQQRVLDSATLPVMRVVEVASEQPLPDWARHDPDIARMTWLAASHVAYANDLFSYRKEVEEQASPWNLLAVVMHNHRLDLPEAVIYVVDSLNEDTREFVSLNQKWSGKDADPAVAAYLGGLRCWMRGNVEFSLRTPRYSLPL